jgi:lipopolysaccharide/colanic/teichoic acid biosynthesis glycosyltransferase
MDERAREPRYKRPMDLTILLLAHVVLLPLWLLLWVLIPLLIWLEDRGPVFYRQERVGRGGRSFGLFKFRSMSVMNEGESWPGFTTRDDPRITRIGRLLRSTALDELPQIINLWRGDISLVGPRALPPYMYDDYLKEEPRFARRLRIRPGLTGLSQTRLPRHCGARRRLRYDLLYIREANLMLDLVLIIQSVWLTLTRQWGKGLRASEPAFIEEPASK